MKKTLFLFFLLTGVLPSFAQRASTVTMVTKFPVTYVSYDTLYAQQLKVGLDRNNPAMLKIRQEPSLPNLADPLQTGDFVALRKLSVEGVPGLKASNTTIQADVALGNTAELCLPSVGDDLILGQQPPAPTPEPGLAMARFGRGRLRVLGAGTTLGLGVHELVIKGGETNLPPVIEKLSKLNCGGVGRSATWVLDGNKYHLKCKTASSVQDLNRYLRVPGVRQQKISDSNGVSANPVAEWHFPAVWSPIYFCKVPLATPTEDLNKLATYETKIEDGMACNGTASPDCVRLRECTIEDGCLYVKEDGKYVNEEDGRPLVWESWKCVDLKDL